MSDILRDFDKNNEFPKVKLNLPKFDFSHLNEAVTNMNTIFDNIVKDIRDRQDNAMAMEFTKCIGELLKKNGVVPKITEYTRNFETDNTFETRYGVSIDELDFSEHDKVFEDKIEKLQEQYAEKHKDYLNVSSLLSTYQSENDSLKKRIAELETELEGKERPLRTEIDTSTPLDCANSLIHHLTHLDAFLIAPERDVQTFTLDDLEQIAEHLLVYCKHNKVGEE